MTDDDLATFTDMRSSLDSSDAQLYAGNREQNKASRAAKKKSMVLAPAGAMPNGRSNEKRKNRETELELNRMMRLGIDDGQASQTTAEDSKFVKVPPPTPLAASVTADLMAASRRARGR